MKNELSLIVHILRKKLSIGECLLYFLFKNKSAKWHSGNLDLIGFVNPNISQENIDKMLLDTK